jgi:hypothetical protein
MKIWQDTEVLLHGGAACLTFPPGGSTFGCSIGVVAEAPMTLGLALAVVIPVVLPTVCTNSQPRLRS